MTDDRLRWTPLAIVGASCRIPGAKNLDEFWDLVRTGGDATGELPNEVLDRELYYDPQPVKLGKSYSSVGGLIPRLPFDNTKCRLPEEEIANYDASHLTMCEVASEALSDANYDPFDLPIRNAGVYFGHTGGTAVAGELMYAIGIEQTAQYLHEVEGLRHLPKTQRDEIIEKIIEDTRRDYDFRRERPDLAIAAISGCELIARAFGLNGPCVVVDAACASSLQALAIGARALVHKSIDMAIVGGAACCKGDSLILFSAAQSVTSGKSCPFDTAASGLVTSEGYVTFVLKRLDEAVAAGDRIRGVIRGIGMSSDGKGKSLWAPLKTGQKLAIHRAYDETVRPCDIHYMEAHATSTQVGDATELAALAEAFPSELENARKIPLGSVKANIGHTLETAGAAGLLKTLLAMEHGVIPPCANLETPNSDIAWDKLPFSLPREPIAWGRLGTQTRKAAVNAFGIGGLNVHIVLEEHSPQLSLSYYGHAVSPTVSETVREPIAVIGMGVILPGARSVEEFWQLLKSGRDPKTQVTPDRWNAELCYDPSEASDYRSYCDVGGFCTDYKYDWKKHRVPPKQIAAANPLQFMLLDAADQALSQSGYLDKSLDGARVGVIVGTNFGGDFSDDLQMGLKLPDFEKRLSKLLSQRGWQSEQIAKVNDQYAKLLLTRKPALIDETGSFTSSTLASRITKTFNLRGGALALDAGVGAGLAALSAAVDTLRSGDCDMMICAAGQRSMDLPAFEGASIAGLLARGKRTPAFDEQSDGYVLGEGCAVVLLKKLSDAKRDGDKVLGVIHDVAAAANWEFEGQACELAIKRALQHSNVSRDAIRAVEAIGTVPKLENAEVRAAVKALLTPDRDQELLFSSIVPQFGYMGATHSLAATIKACLAFSHGELPAPLAPKHVRQGLFPAGSSAQQTQTSLRDSECSEISILGGPGRGTCYHAIVGPEPKPSQREPSSSAASPATTTARILRFGAPSREALQHRLQSCRATEVWTSQKPFSHDDAVRLAIVCENEGELSARLEELKDTAVPRAADERDRWAACGVYFGEPSQSTSRCAFIFPGHSSQYPGMFADAILALPAAAAAKRQADASLKALGFQPFEDFAGVEASGLGTDLWTTQAGILVGSWIAYQTLTSLGLHPSSSLGHSFGEYMALVAAGTWSLTDAIRAARFRTEAIESVTGLDGVMAATGADRETIRDVLSEIDGVFVANYNSPQQTVISGHRRSVLEAIERLKTRRASAVLIKVPAPFHTPLLAPAAEWLASRLADLPVRRAQFPIISTAGLGAIREPDQIVSSLSQQMVTTVDFPRMLDELLLSRPALVVEAGPKQVLTRLCRTLHPDSGVLFMASDNPKRKRALSLLDVVAQADCLGCLDTQSSKEPLSVETRPSKQAPRILTFDATEGRRRRMRSQSEQVTDSRTTPPNRRIGTVANGSGNGNGHHHDELASAVAVSSTETAARFATPQSTAPITVPSTKPSLEPPTRVATSDLLKENSPVDVNELKQILIDFVVEQTGYPDEMIEMDIDLEADLGIDSIKKAQLFGEVGTRFSIAPREDLSLDDFPTLQHVVDFLVDELGASTPPTSNDLNHAPVAESIPSPIVAPVATIATETSNDNVDVDELRQILINFVVEQTGYPEDMIEMDVDLEADLGIDSIKKAQLFGEVGTRFSIAPREDLSLDDFPTLQHVADFLVTELASSGGSQVPPERSVAVAQVTDRIAKVTDRIAKDTDLIDHDIPAPLVAVAVTTPAPRSEAGIDVNELQQILVDFVVEQTGYPEEMIELDVDLEADLGIDSIKKAQLFGEVGSRFAIAPRDDLSLDDFPTLQHVIDFLVDELGTAASRSEGPSETPVSALTISSPPRNPEPPATIPEFARVIQLYGTGADRGREHGAAFRREIQRNVVKLASGAPGVRAAKSDWSEEFQDELAAIADAAFINEDAIYAWNSIGKRACQRIAFTEPSESCEANDGVAAAIQVRQGEGESTYLTVGHAGQLDIAFGVNGARLAVSSIPASEHMEGIDVATVTQTLHKILASCSRVGEAMHLLQTLRTTSNWVIGLSERSSFGSKFVLVSENGVADCDQDAPALRAFHDACSSDTNELKIFDRQSKAVQTVSLVDLVSPMAPTATSPILPREQQIFQRHVMRMVPVAITATRRQAIPTGEKATIVGDGPVAAELQSQLASQGCIVELISAVIWQQTYRDYLEKECPRHLIFVASADTALDSFQSSRQLTEILLGCQHWIMQLEQAGQLTGASLVAASHMGGDFGFGSRSSGFAGGAMTGLLKGIRREFPALRAKVADFAPDEAPAIVVGNLLNELCGDCSQLEVGYRDGTRFVVSAVAEDAQESNDTPIVGDVWVVTGGGRGVTAAIAREMGRAYGVSLHLLGTAPSPARDAEWRGLDEQGLKDLRRKLALQAREQGMRPDQLWRPIEKAMELDRNLASLQRAGIRAAYHQCNIADQSDLAGTLDSIRASDGAICGIIHGAGFEAACRFTRKQPELVHATIASKCDGASNLIALTRKDPLKHFVGFGSTSGRFGGLGQADYSLASDLLAKMVGRLAEERPECKAICFHWPAWGEVGMAARPESRMALEHAGLTFMSPEEGVSHFAAELVAAGHDHEVLILNSPGPLDTDGTMSRHETGVDPEVFRRPIAETNLAASTSPLPKQTSKIAVSTSDPLQLVQDLRPGSSSDEAYADLFLDPATDPFLAHHTLRGKPILPGVMTMQAFAEAAQLLRPNEQFIGLTDVSLGRGLSVAFGDTLSATIRIKNSSDGVHCELFAPFTNSRGQIVDPARVYATATVDFGLPLESTPLQLGEPIFDWFLFKYQPQAPIKHGALLRTFKSLSFEHGAGLGMIEGRLPSQLLGPRTLKGIALPSAELDGCLVACGFFVFGMIDRSVNLPHAIKSFRFCRQPGHLEECKLRFAYQGKSQAGHRFDFVLVGESGHLLLKVDGYETVAIKE